jgi:transposase
MTRIELSQADIKDIEDAMDDPSLSDKHRTKLLVIRMHSEGGKHGFIAKCLKLHANTITNYLKEWMEGGLPAVVEDKYYRPSSAIEPFMACLRCSFAAAPVADAKAAIARIEALSGITLSESQARRTLHKLGMKYRKAASIPGKCDAQLQFDFYQQEMLPRLAQAARGERKVFFVDAAHFVMGAFLGMLWCFGRIFIKTSPGRQRYSVLGAIESHSHEIISVTTDGTVSAPLVTQLLDKIRLAHPNTPITLVLDNARYQRCKEVANHAATRDIELLYLPAYSPNLNLIERLWKLTKKKCLTNKHYQNFTDFRAAIDACLERMAGDYLTELKSLITPKFQFFTSHKSS